MGDIDNFFAKKDKKKKGSKVKNQTKSLGYEI